MAGSVTNDVSANSLHILKLAIMWLQNVYRFAYTLAIFVASYIANTDFVDMECTQLCNIIFRVFLL